MDDFRRMADARGIDREIALRLRKALARFLEADVDNVKQLDGFEPRFRLRIGAYRIRFYDHGETIEILAVKHRSEAYR